MHRLQVDWTTWCLSDTKCGYLQFWHWEDLCGWSTLQSELPTSVLCCCMFCSPTVFPYHVWFTGQYTQAWKDFCPNLYSTNYSIDCTYTSSQELILNPFLYAYCTTVCIISQHAHSMYTVPQNVLYNEQYVHHTTYVQYACIRNYTYTIPLYVYWTIVCTYVHYRQRGFPSDVTIYRGVTLLQHVLQLYLKTSLYDVSIFIKNTIKNIDFIVMNTLGKVSQVAYTIL